jgi:putative addiction module component (TIGR02574 family)
MSSDSTLIFAAALSLPDDDRANLAYQLLQSLKPAGILDEDDPQMDDLLQRRIDDYESGQSDAADWEDVALRLRQTLDGKKSS